MTKQKNYGLYLCLGASLLLSLCFIPSVEELFCDKEFFKYGGRGILHGLVPYRDFFDHKPPLIFFINAAGLLLGPWGLWIITTIFALAITWLFYRLCRRYNLYYPWLLPLLFNLMLRDNLITSGVNFTREYSTYFVMLFFLSLMSTSRHRLLGLGLFTAMTFFTQQDQVLQLVPFLVFVLWERSPVSVARRLTLLAAGFALIVFPLLCYFAIHHALGDVWQDAFLFNFQTYIREYKSLGDHFRTIKRVLDDGNYELPFMIAVILGVLALAMRSRKKQLIAAAILALFLSLSSEMMGGRTKGLAINQDSGGYFLPVAGTVCILLFLVFAFNQDPAFVSWKTQLPYVFLLCTSLTYTAFQHATHLRHRDFQQEIARPEADYLDRQALSDHQLYIMWDEDFAEYYNLRKIEAPSRWFYQHFWIWYPKWDPDHQYLQSIADDLTRYKTTYLYLEDSTYNKMPNKANHDWWDSFVKTHYHRLSLPGKPESNLWKRND